MCRKGRFAEMAMQSVSNQALGMPAVATRTGVRGERGHSLSSVTTATVATRTGVRGER